MAIIGLPVTFPNVIDPGSNESLGTAGAGGAWLVVMVEALLVEQVVLNGSSSTDLFEVLRKNAPEIYTFPKTNECLLKKNLFFFWTGSFLGDIR